MFSLCCRHQGFRPSYLVRPIEGLHPCVKWTLRHKYALCWGRAHVVKWVRHRIDPSQMRYGYANNAGSIYSSAGRLSLSRSIWSSFVIVIGEARPPEWCGETLQEATAETNRTTRSTPEPTRAQDHMGRKLFARGLRQLGPKRRVCRSQQE